MSRFRGSSAVKEPPRPASYSKDRLHDEQENQPLKSFKNGSNRYHFGMTRQRGEEGGKNGRDYREQSDEDADLLYKKSKEHFGAWDMKDIVQDEGRRSRKQTDRFERPLTASLTNGRSRNDARQDRRDDHGAALLRGDRSISIDREQSKKQLKKETWEEVDPKTSLKSSRSKNSEMKDDLQKTDERDLLLKEIENLAVDGRSPDRRIRAMIERFKFREENKICKRRDSLSPERDEHRSKSAGRGDNRDHEDRVNDRDKVRKDDREDERRRSKIRSPERLEIEEAGRSRSVDRRLEKFSDPLDKHEDSKRNDSLRQKNDAQSLERNHPRRSREMKDDLPRRKDSPKRRRYAYDGNPEDFDVRIQRYERTLLEPRRDLDSTRRAPLKDAEESFKDYDRQVSSKSSFKSGDSKKRESSLGRKASFKNQENDLYRKNSFKNPDIEKKYFGRDSEHVSRKGSFKEQGYEVERKNSFMEQSSDYGRISVKNRENEEERKNSFRGHGSGVSRITFKKQDDESGSHLYKDQDSEIGRVNCKDHSELGKKNSFKEKTVEFAGISYKDHEEEDLDRRTIYKNEDYDPNGGHLSFRSVEDSKKRHSPNGRYVEFGTISYQTQDEDSRGSPSNDQDQNLEIKSLSSKDQESSKRRSSPKNRSHEASDKKPERHLKPLNPPKRDETGYLEDSKEEFSSWHESNRLFAAKYLRENRYRSNPEGRSEIERDPSPEDLQDPRQRKHSNEEFSNQMEDLKRDHNNQKPEYSFGKPEQSLEARYSSTHERNGATIIRIRSSPETPTERRRRRRPAQESQVARRRRQGDAEDEEDTEDEEEDRRGRPPREGFATGRGVSTPSRRIWNYREGGVLITDVEEGQPCLQCGDTCPGFSPHTWRKNCTSCKCPREAHDVCHEEWVSVRSRLGLKGDESSSPVGFDPRSKGLAWAPPGLPAHKVEEYFSMLPEMSVPRLGTPGERYRDRQLAIQLPKQDLARAYCRHLNPKHASSADDFMAARTEIAVDIGTVQEVLEKDLYCGGCRAHLKCGSLAVSASKLDLLYHPACFQCSECKELLVDLAYCVHDDTLFCERHYAEQLKPRCAACDELIFSGEYTKAMNKDWHSGHFCCWQCDESLTGQRYVLRDEHPYCIKCYESVFANGCEECNKIIGIDSKDLSYKDKHWHEACFLCNRCRVSLVDKQFGSKVDKIYCGNCYDAQFASRCDGCGEIFRAGTKKMEYKTRQWHEKCFCCVVCKNPIGTKSFIPREQEIYCAGCYENKFATRCVKCDKIITSGGVTYKNEPWHRDCFTCSNCNNSLAGQRFTSRDDKPYCADCFGELFAKRCTACSKPITGIGGTRFISFEDRHWHNDCFICAGCKTSLVGRGFITDNEDIICPECAKMKLM